jgi:queuine tRNA-ribosyltransferase
MPKDKPRYLMGVGTPPNILQAVSRSVDFFDCVLPARNARHGHIFTRGGAINIRNERFKADDSPPDPGCGCPTCVSYSRAYLRHLFMAGEVLALRLSVCHNLYFYNTFMAEIRQTIKENRFNSFKKRFLECWSSGS